MQGCPHEVKAWADAILVGNSALVAGDCHGSTNSVLSKSTHVVLQCHSDLRCASSFDDHCRTVRQCDIDVSGCVNVSLELHVHTAVDLLNVLISFTRNSQWAAVVGVGSLSHCGSKLYMLLT